MGCYWNTKLKQVRLNLKRGRKVESRLLYVPIRRGEMGLGRSDDEGAEEETHGGGEDIVEKSVYSL